MNNPLKKRWRSRPSMMNHHKNNGKPDNWLVAHLFALRAVELFDSDKSTGKAPEELFQRL